jgi:NTE family protein
MSALVSLAAGQPGFYAPVMPPAIMRPQGAPGAVSVYDTNALRKTLEELVDFDRINSGRTRLSLGAVNIRLGNFIYFDNTERTITVDHVMASGALPPGFPPVQVDGELYWDGGLVSNTPLAPVLEYGPKKDTLVFQVDLFSARGDVPRDVWEGEARRKQIVFSSRTRLNTDYFREKHELRMAIVQLFEKLPPDARQKAEMQKLRDLGEDHAISIVHLIYRPQRYEGLSADYEFSRATMEQHWQAGIENVERTLRHQEWNEPPSAADGLKVFDIAEAEMDQLRRSYAPKRRMSSR